MKKEFVDYIKSLPPWAKGLALVGGIGIIFITFKSVIERVKAEASKKKLENNKNELEEKKKKGEKANYEKSQFDGWAGQIQDAFDGCDPELTPFGLSTSGQTVYDIVSRIYSDIDFLELVDSFGTRTWDACGWFMGDVKNKTLFEGITDELNDSEIAKINTQLLSNGLTYQF